MLVLSLIAAFAFQTQSAPPDVPKDHWAFPAVDALFREGLLKGYPAGKQFPLNLDKNLKRDDALIKVWLRDWYLEGWLVGYTAFHRRDNADQWAVDVCLTWLYLTRDWYASRDRSEPLPESLTAYPKIAQAISMLEPELTELAMDPEEMIAKLNNLRESQYRLFHGDR